MIPKIVHYCWLSDDPYPGMVRRCMKSWNRHLKGYDFVKWDFKRFPRGKSKWVDQAFDSGKYAFAADYIRLYALYHFGGIYLDTDVEVIKSFDDLLELPYFLGKEKLGRNFHEASRIEAATMGFSPKHPLVGAVLEEISQSSFILEDGSYNLEVLPRRFRNCLDGQFQENGITSFSEFSYCPSVINLFPEDWFSPKNWDTQEIEVTDNTYSIHHFSASWWSQRERAIHWANRKFGPLGGYYVRYFWCSPQELFSKIIRSIGRKIRC